MTQCLQISCSQNKTMHIKKIHRLKGIEKFFRSYRCPVCHESIFDEGANKNHQIKYSFEICWEKEKECSLKFDNMINRCLNCYLEEITAGLKSAKVSYQKIASKLLDNNNIRFIQYCVNNNDENHYSHYDPETRDVWIISDDTATLYHEIGHSIFHNFFTEGLFNDFDKARTNEYTQETKKKIDDYFKSTYHIEEVIKSDADLYNNLYQYLGNNYAHLIDVSSALRCDEDDSEIIHLPGHDIEYWQRDNIRTDELFADIFCEYATGRSDVIKLFKRFLPKCLDEYEKIINALMEYLGIID